MKHITPLLLCLCLLLCACQSEPGISATAPDVAPTEVTTVPATVPTTEDTTPPETTEAPTEEPTQAPTEAPTEPPMLYTHPITGQPLADPFDVRPVAVVINNTPAAQPLLGVGYADIIFEHIAEGGGTITRFLAVFTDLEPEFTLGSIRSARTYLLDLARVFHAPIAHCGYSGYAQQYIKETGYPSFNEFTYGQYYYRDQDRRAAGYALEHTLVINADGLLLGLQENKFNLTVEPDTRYGMEFSNDVSLDGEPANRICMRFFSEYGKTTTMTYDAETGVYYGTQQWNSREETIYDGNTGEAVPFKNVLMLNMRIRFADDNYHMLTDMTGEGTGFYACNGTYVPIKWFRETPDDPFTYTYADGTPLYLAPGKTYVGILNRVGPEIIFE